jgi:hypothetical protein
MKDTFEQNITNNSNMIVRRTKDDINAINQKKVITYSDKDPRFNFMIQDSDEYNRQILPIGMSAICKKSSKKMYKGSNENYVAPEPNDPEFDGIVIRNIGKDPASLLIQTNRKYPSRRALSCGSERYENCISSVLDKEYDKCVLDINYDHLDLDTDLDSNSDLDLDLDLDTDSKRRFKNLNKNTLYDVSYVPKKTVSNDNVIVDYSPDIGPVIRRENINPDGITKKETSVEIVGPMVELFPDTFSEITDTVCTPCMKICCPFCPSWVTPEQSCIMSLIVCLICILIPCIISCMTYF